MLDNDHDHELKFWLSYEFKNGSFLHRGFYEQFFPFQSASGNILEIGCGGAPFYSYIDGNFDKSKITLIDPLLQELAVVPKYSHLSGCDLHSCNFSDFQPSKNYDTIICLNVIDHFPIGQDLFLQKLRSCLSEDGTVFLYYDIREEHANGHYAVDKLSTIQAIDSNFEVLRQDFSINPVHAGWSKVYESHRAILKKRKN